MELLLGCGRSREKKMALPGKREWTELVTLDFDRTVKPDLIWDFSNNLHLPFIENQFDEVHAYDVMEHLGAQGNFSLFFFQWSEIHRILKPSGHFFGLSPAFNSPWAWGDPGHTRIISGESLAFLHQPNYSQVGTTPMTDYRFCYKADFDILHSAIVEQQFQYVLQAVKPSRIAL